MKKIRRNSLFFIVFVLNVLPLTAQQMLVPWEGIRSTRVRLWRYEPTREKRNGMAVILCPGGSYHHLGIGHEGHNVAKELAKHGFFAYVFRYSTSTYGYHYPYMMEDIQMAVNMVKGQADSLGFQKDKVGIMGFSAGGHMVGWMGTYFDTDLLTPLGVKREKDLKPYFVAMIYPVVTFRPPYVHQKSFHNLLDKNLGEDLIHQMSLEENVHEDMPPVYLLACKDDNVVHPQNSIIYDQALTEKKVPHRFVLMDEGGHGFGFEKRGSTLSKLWLADFITWIQSWN